MLVAMVCGTLAFAGVICLGLPFRDKHPSSRGLLDKHTILVLQVLQRSCLGMLAPDLCSPEELFAPCAMPLSRADAVRTSVHGRISGEFHEFSMWRWISLVAASFLRPGKHCMLYWSVALLHSDACFRALRCNGLHSSTDGTCCPPTMLSCRASPGFILGAATHRPLFIPGAKWLLAEATQEEDRRRGRVMAPGSDYLRLHKWCRRLHHLPVLPSAFA